MVFGKAFKAAQQPYVMEIVTAIISETPDPAKILGLLRDYFNHNQDRLSIMAELTINEHEAVLVLVKIVEGERILDNQDR